MVKRAFLLSALLTTSVAGIAAAGIVGNTQLSLRASPALFFKQGARVVLSGHFETTVPTCRGRRVVRLFRRTGGSSYLVARTVTGRDGTFTFVLRPNRTMTVYAAYLGSFRSSYGLQRSCDRSHSALLTLRAAKA